MPWNAITEENALRPGSTIQIETGEDNSLPQQGDVIAVAYRNVGTIMILNVVSAAADQLTVRKGNTYLTLIPNMPGSDIAKADQHRGVTWMVK